MQIRHHSILILSLGLAVLILAVVVTSQDRIYRWVINPHEPHQTYIPAEFADYSERQAWALIPEKKPMPPIKGDWGVDIFFIHPTLDYEGNGWNSDPEDAEVQARLNNEILPNFLGPFWDIGAVYAPHYRSATLFSFLTHREDAREALQFAYQDVDRAFDTYLKEHNQFRAILVVGIGQGGLMAMRLLQEKFKDPDLKERLVAAYLIDTAVPMSVFSNSLSHLEPCATSETLHCVAGWSAFEEKQERRVERFLTRSQYWTDKGQLLAISKQMPLCVNPVLWTTKEDHAPRRLHLGGARAIGLQIGQDTPAILPAETSAQCVNGIVLIDRPKSGELRSGWRWGDLYKTSRYNLFYADISVNARLRAQRAAEWLAANRARPAPSLISKTVDLGEVNEASIIPPQDIDEVDDANSDALFPWEREN